MKRRQQIVKQRIRVFFGCEGEGEQGYGGLIQRLADETNLSIHLHTHLLTPGAGDPLSRIKRAIQDSGKFERQRGTYKFKFVLMDQDQVVENPDRQRETENLAHGHGINIIWQNLCHESFLLHHLTGFEHHNPPSSEKALATLKQQWPNYRKPMNQTELSRVLDIASVKRAAGVEPLFHYFLRSIRLV